ncbi:MAG: hypothetical protein R2838_12015 [Caldilineaceae bacterium]
MLIGDVGQIVESNLREAARKRIRAYIQDRRMLAFAEVDIAPDFYTGALTVAQSHGVGGLEPNTVLLGWSRTPEGRTRQIELMHALAGLGKSVLFLRYDGERGYGKRRVIDVWWGGRGGNADLMLLLAYIISQHRSWADANIRLLRIIDGEEGRAGTLAHMQATLDAVRHRHAGGHRARRRPVDPGSDQHVESGIRPVAPRPPNSRTSGRRRIQSPRRPPHGPNGLRPPGPQRPERGYFGCGSVRARLNSKNED